MESARVSRPAGRLAAAEGDGAGGAQPTIELPGQEAESNGVVLDTLARVYPKAEEVCTATLDTVKFVTHWTFLPLVIYIGISISEPKPSLVQILSPF